MSALIRDTNLKVTKALPAAGDTNYSDAIDLQEASPGITTRKFQVEVAVPALPSLADAKTYIATLQDSADGASFADVASLASLSFLGAGGAGAAAATRLYKLPEDIRRYIRVKSVVLSSGGDNTAKSVTLSVVY